VRDKLLAAVGGQRYIVRGNVRGVACACVGWVISVSPDEVRVAIGHGDDVYIPIDSVVEVTPAAQAYSVREPTPQESQS
jgi:hypothetical protein